ncbi:MAG: glycine--tRNA ligase subunit beta [Planctomycetes bacterium]|nr:glycine--tRNA ligase subunit beta [Planctomycetota bacterium]
MVDLLVELRTEEIPAGYLGRALEALQDEVRQGLDDASIAHGDVSALGTPRRLTVVARAVAARQPDRRETALGPAAKAAFDPDGAPTRAAEGFARAHGVSVADLEVRETPKGRYVCVDKQVAGQPTLSLLPDILSAAVRSIPFPKSMRWASREFTFARPIRGVLALLGEQPIDWELNGVRAGRTLHGHPFLAPEPIVLERADPEAYVAALQRAYVMVDPAARLEAVTASLTAAAEAAGGAFHDGGLVAEVTNMVEYPGVLAGVFEERFLELPRVVIEAVLRSHQRYFSITRPDGRLAARFLAVVDRPDAMFDRIRRGHERVIRARLVDAEFFLATDARKPLRDRSASLDHVIFLKDLGTLGDRVGRLRALARNLGMVLFGGETAERAERAAALSKCDLVTAMVGEFPELQGHVGEVYAHTLDGEPAEVAAAIREQYLPRGPDDEVPASAPGQTLALADRLDLLAGCFLKGLEPTGSRDPYGLRRAALGVIRIVHTARLGLDLAKWAEKAAAGYRGLLPEADHPESPITSLKAYLRERVRAHFLERGMRHELVGAAIATGWGDLLHLEARLEALHELHRDPRFPALVELVERTHNISRELDEEVALRTDLLVEPVEKELFARVRELEGPVCEAFAAGDFIGGSWRYLAGLGELLARYFDTVFVNVEDRKLRRNRWTLLRAVHRLYRDHVADLSRVPQSLAEEVR